MTNGALFNLGHSPLFKLTRYTTYRAWKRLYYGAVRNGLAYSGKDVNPNHTLFFELTLVIPQERQTDGLW